MLSATSQTFIGLQLFAQEAKAVMHYLASNKEWVFSGIGVVALTAAVASLRFILFSRKSVASNQSIRQSQKSGHSSINSQIGTVEVSVTKRG